MQSFLLIFPTTLFLCKFCVIMPVIIDPKLNYSKSRVVMFVFNNIGLPKFENKICGSSNFSKTSFNELKQI